MAHAAGVTVFAVVMTERHLDDRIAGRLGRAGADKVLACEGPGLGAPPLDMTHGPALYAAVERIPPLLVLFPAGGAGAQLGPGLASRLGGAFAATADLELGAAATPLADGVGRVFVRRWRADRTSYRRLDPVELERPVVAILPAGGPIEEHGSGEAEVEVISCAAPAKLGVVEVASDVDEHAATALASVLVVVDPSVGEAALAKLIAAAPPGVVVVDAVSAAPAIALAVPRVILTVGNGSVRLSGTPRSRVGAVAPAPPAPAKRGKGGGSKKEKDAAAARVPADVLLPLPPRGASAGASDGSWEAVIDELAAALPALGGVAGKEPRS